MKRAVSSLYDAIPYLAELEDTLIDGEEWSKIDAALVPDIVLHRYCMYMTEVRLNFYDVMRHIRLFKDIQIAHPFICKLWKRGEKIFVDEKTISRPWIENYKLAIRCRGDRSCS